MNVKTVNETNFEIKNIRVVSLEALLEYKTTCTWKGMTYPTKTNSPMELTEDTLEEMLAAFEGCDTFHAPW